MGYVNFLEGSNISTWNCLCLYLEGSHSPCNSFTTCICIIATARKSHKTLSSWTHEPGSFRSSPFKEGFLFATFWGVWVINDQSRVAGGSCWIFFLVCFQVLYIHNDSAIWHWSPLIPPPWLVEAFLKSKAWTSELKIFHRVLFKDVHLVIWEPLGAVFFGSAPWDGQKSHWCCQGFHSSFFISGNVSNSQG